jgi:putative flavoprotein involved in K+ transport
MDEQVVVIGGGQAGLAVSYELAATGVVHQLVERDRVGHAWAGLWESFRVNTPNWSLRLPGLPYDGDEPDGFMSRQEIVTYLQRYAELAGDRIREGVGVMSLVPTDGGFRLETSEGPITTRCVVVCTGAYQAPFRPPGTEALPEHILEVETRSYRAPDQLPPGAVLVIGNGQSGCQIAEELLEAGREVVVACGKAAWAPRRVGEHDLFWWVIETGFMDATVDDLPSPTARLAATLTASGVNGGHDLHARTLRAKGATLTGRFLGHESGRFRFADDLAAGIAWSDARYLELREDIEGLRRTRGIDVPDLPDPEPFDPIAPTSVDASDVGALIVSGGFRPDYARWVHVPGAFDDQGFPVQHDGASTVAPGLFFAGVHFLRKRKSSLLFGIGEDAAIVADGVAAHLASTGP